MLLVNTRSGRAAVQVPAPSLMLDDGEVERRVRLLRPMEHPAISVAMKAQTHWEPADRGAFIRAWEKELAEIPAFAESYRLQTDSGERIIGRLVSPAWVAQAADTETPTIAPADAWTAVLDGRTVLQLQEGPRFDRRPRSRRPFPRNDPGATIGGS
jgi:hypothetical protein